MKKEKEMNFIFTIMAIIAGVALTACEDNSGVNKVSSEVIDGSDAGVASDADTDVDSDADTDADSDSDSDKEIADQALLDYCDKIYDEKNYGANFKNGTDWEVKVTFLDKETLQVGSCVATSTNTSFNDTPFTWDKAIERFVLVDPDYPEYVAYMWTEQEKLVQECKDCGLGRSEYPVM
jgi:hypothetical protein